MARVCLNTENGLRMVRDSAPKSAQKLHTIPGLQLLGEDVAHTSLGFFGTSSEVPRRNRHLEVVVNDHGLIDVQYTGHMGQDPLMITFS